jgi:hypothetical protein
MGKFAQSRHMLFFLLPMALLAGNKKSAAPSPKVVSSHVDPAQITLIGEWTAQQILVTATYSDGSLHDVTPHATFKSAAPKIAAVSPTGIVTPVSDGKALLAISVKGTKKINVSVIVKRSQDIETITRYLPAIPIKVLPRPLIPSEAKL